MTSFRLPSINDAYAYAATFLGKRETKKVDNNTYLIHERDGDLYYVKLHGTPIITITRKAVMLNAGGYRTPTTKDRFNRILPSGTRVDQEKGIWWLSHASASWPFADGITIHRTIHRTGKVTGKGNVTEDTAQVKAVQAYAKAFAEAALKGEVPAPSGGDCFFCGMTVAEGTDKGKSLGDATGDTGHLQGHLREHYHVPSLLVNAARARGNNYLLNFILPDLWAPMDAEARRLQLSRSERAYKREISKTLRQYLGAKLGLALR